jgi:hypothetical protein
MTDLPSHVVTGRLRAVKDKLDQMVGLMAGLMQGVPFVQNNLKFLKANGYSPDAMNRALQMCDEFERTQRHNLSLINQFRNEVEGMI